MCTKFAINVKSCNEIFVQFIFRFKRNNKISILFENFSRNV